jgi:hypothetical protein
MISIRRCGASESGLAMNGSFRTCSTTGWRVLQDKPGIKISGGRHPVVEQVLKEPFIANPLSLPDGGRR